MKPRPIIATLVLLFGPALISIFSRGIGVAAAACSVVILVLVILGNEKNARR